MLRRTSTEQDRHACTENGKPVSAVVPCTDHNRCTGASGEDAGRTDKPVIAERAMYWGEGTPLGEACHDSVGTPAAHSTFFLPDGETQNGYETWTLVQNPNPGEIEVLVSYLTPDGNGDIQFTDTLPPNSRKSYSMADRLGAGKASAVVKCVTAGKKIIVERSMYWSNMGAGTCTIGGFSD